MSGATPDIFEASAVPVRGACCSVPTGCLRQAGDRQGAPRQAVSCLGLRRGPSHVPASQRKAHAQGAGAHGRAHRGRRAGVRGRAPGWREQADRRQMAREGEGRRADGRPPEPPPHAGEAHPARRRGRGLRGPRGVGDRLLRLARGGRRARRGRQRARLPQPPLQRVPGGPRRQAQAHKAVRPLAERQGRAHEPEARAGVAVRPGVGERGLQGGGSGGLHGPLQLGQAARRLRGPAPSHGSTA